MNKFEQYLKLVQEQAQRQNKKFFLDCAEGRNFECGDLAGSDLSGWLIPFSDVTEFAERFHAQEGVDPWLDHMVFVVWQRKGDTITVAFKNY